MHAINLPGKCYCMTINKKANSILNQINKVQLVCEQQAEQQSRNCMSASVNAVNTERVCHTVPEEKHSPHQWTSEGFWSAFRRGAHQSFVAESKNSHIASTLTKVCWWELCYMELHRVAGGPQTDTAAQLLAVATFIRVSRKERRG